MVIKKKKRTSNITDAKLEGVFFFFSVITIIFQTMASTKCSNKNLNLNLPNILSFNIFGGEVCYFLLVVDSNRILPIQGVTCDAFVVVGF